MNMKKVFIILMVLFLAAGLFATTADGKYETIEDLNGLPIGVQTAVLYEVQYYFSYPPAIVLMM